MKNEGKVIKCADIMDYRTSPAQSASGGEIIQDHFETETTIETEE